MAIRVNQVEKEDGANVISVDLAENPAYPCCSFRGSIVALDEKSGAILWKTFDMPDNGGQTGGYSGGAVWQPPVIDAKRGMLFIGTGNNYSACGCGSLPERNSNSELRRS